MKINSVDVNFTRRLIANCNVKNAQREKHTASLYEYNPYDKEDVKEIEKSMHTGAIWFDFYKAGLWHNHSADKFYVIKDDETGEIAASCELTHYKKGRGIISSDFIHIKEIEGNKEYIDSLTPMMSFISKLAQFHNADSVIATEFATDYDAVEGYKFQEDAPGVFVLPEKRYAYNIIKGEQRNQINYNV